MTSRVNNNLYGTTPEKKTGSGRRYGFALLVLAAATAVRALLTPLIGPTAVPFIAYFPAVVAASFYGGLGPGLLVVLLGALFAHYFFIPPTFTLQFAGPGDVLALLTFVAASGVIVLLNELRDRAAAEARRHQALAVQRETQLQVEVQERDRARKEAADAQRWAQDTLASIGDGVICTDLGGRITFLNSQAEQLTGWNQDEAVGKRLPEVFVVLNENTHQAIESPVHRVLVEGVKTELEHHVMLKRRDGSELPVADSGAPILAADRQTVGAVVVFRDITERKTLEDELRQTAQRLEHSNKELLAFAYTVSHDLQDPLRTLTSFSQLLQRKYQDSPAADDEARGWLAFIVSASTRMSAMIRNLLAWSNAVNASAGVFTSVRIQDAVHWAEQNLLDRIRETSTEIVIETPATVVADHVQLVQLFQNLISNAIKYRSEHDPVIRISVKEQLAFWHITVSDNGRGISESNRDVIFDLFKRGDADKPDESSSGVGLAICKRIVQRHGGDIWVESTFGQGSTFHVTLQRRTPELKSAK